MPTKRALIVDDSTTAQYRLKKMLKAYDLQIDAVDSGEAALLHLASHVPDVIFMDHLMPGMDGFRALQIIKSHPETAMVPVVMYTSRSGDVYTGQARALGALDVISKDTINTADLSKVMEGIHIFRKSHQPLADESADHEDLLDEEIKPGLDLSDLPPAETLPPMPAPRAEGPMADNSRRIELRISQLEHAIDDSRRVITARLVREIQKLRHSVVNELAEHSSKKSGVKPAVEPADLPPPVVLPEPQPSNFFAIATLLLLLVAGIFGMNSLGNLNEKMIAFSEQQAEQQAQLNKIANKLLEMQMTVEMQGDMTVEQSVANTNKVVKSSTLNDMVWAFNQAGVIPFNPGIVDSTAIQRLNDFVYRIGEQGFKGAVWINLSAGDFCVKTNNSGQAQLPADNDAKLADCVLLSELYRIESLMDHMVDEINSSLQRLASVKRGDINVIVSRLEDPLEAYPVRQSQSLASDWNKVAQNNNRVTVELNDVDSIQ